jgi:hypothetical protein
LTCFWAGAGAGDEGLGELSGFLATGAGAAWGTGDLGFCLISGFFTSTS